MIKLDVDDWTKPQQTVTVFFLKISHEQQTDQHNKQLNYFSTYVNPG